MQQQVLFPFTLHSTPNQIKTERNAVARLTEHTDIQQNIALKLDQKVKSASEHTVYTQHSMSGNSTCQKNDYYLLSCYCSDCKQFHARVSKMPKILPKISDLIVNAQLQHSSSVSKSSLLIDLLVIVSVNIHQLNEECLICDPQHRRRCRLGLSVAVATVSADCVAARWDASYTLLFHTHMQISSSQSQGLLGYCVSSSCRKLAYMWKQNMHDVCIVTGVISDSSSLVLNTSLYRLSGRLASFSSSEVSSELK